LGFVCLRRVHIGDGRDVIVRPVGPANVSFPDMLPGVLPPSSYPFIPAVLGTAGFLVSLGSGGSVVTITAIDLTIPTISGTSSAFAGRLYEIGQKGWRSSHDVSTRPS
jgi:hypothetical protein